jgi:hypothetical protein
VLRPGGRAATAGSILLALSIVGLGDLLSPGERLACRMADPGCTSAAQLSNVGGKMDDILSSSGVLLLVLAAFFLAAAMRRVPGWRAWAWPARWTAVALVIFAVAATGAAAIAALAAGILRKEAR